MDAATVKCHQCKFWLKRNRSGWGVCAVRSAIAEEGLQFRTVLETAPGFGCESGAAGDPKLPDGWDLDRLVALVRGRRGKARMWEMLTMLDIAEDRDDGLKLIRSRGAALGKSLRGAGWRRTKEGETGGYWLPPPE